MTIDEAIERIEGIQLEFLPLPRHLDWKALQLSIEALKRILYQRNYKIVDFWGKLPGETE